LVGQFCYVSKSGAESGFSSRGRTTA
jgi:hypothetical protein